MGLSVSAASAILFTAFIIIFGALFSAVNTYQDNIEAAQDSNYARALEAQQTHISITQVNITNSTIYVQNQGTNSIDITAIDLLINGTLNRSYISSEEIQGYPGSQLWLSNDTLMIHTTVNLSGAHIKIVTGCGAVALYR